MCQKVFKRNGPFRGICFLQWSVRRPEHPHSRKLWRIPSNGVVKRNTTLTLVIKNMATGSKLSVVWKPKTGKTIKRTVTVRNGKASVKTPSKRGTYTLSVTYRGKVLLKKTVRVK